MVNPEILFRNRLEETMAYKSPCQYASLNRYDCTDNFINDTLVCVEIEGEAGITEGIMSVVQ